MVSFFSHAKVLPQDIPNFMTSNGKAIEQVLNYKYLSFILNQELLIKAREKKSGPYTSGEAWVLFQKQKKT